jgi:SAM-dependent methyltransferase
MSNAEREQFSTISTFERPGVPLAYDALVRMMYAPVGGSRAMRETAIDALGITPGTRVLELGCGTGSMTELLVARGADVVAVDGSARMIARARTKAPAAQFEHSRLEDYRTDRKFDQVLFAFVLHEQSASNRKEMLSAAARLAAASRWWITRCPSAACLRARGVPSFCVSNRRASPRSSSAVIVRSSKRRE